MTLSLSDVYGVQRSDMVRAHACGAHAPGHFFVHGQAEWNTMIDLDHITQEQADSAPVTVSVARKIKPGREHDYGAWIKGVSIDAAKYPGHPRLPRHSSQSEFKPGRQGRVRVDLSVRQL